MIPSRSASFKSWGLASLIFNTEETEGQSSTEKFEDLVFGNLEKPSVSLCPSVSSVLKNNETNPQIEPI